MNLNKFTIQKSFAISAGSGKTYTLSRRYINAILGFDFFREKGFEDTYCGLRFMCNKSLLSKGNICE